MIGIERRANPLELVCDSLFKNIVTQLPFCLVLAAGSAFKYGRFSPGNTLEHLHSTLQKFEIVHIHQVCRWLAVLSYRCANTPLLVSPRPEQRAPKIPVVIGAENNDH